MGKRYIGITCLMATAVVLGACDNKSNQPKQKTGIQLNIQMDKTHSATIGAALPDHIPPYAEVYPGADVMAVVDLTAADMGMMITYSTPAQPTEVLAFYKKNAAASNMETTSDSAIQGTLLYAARKKDGSHAQVSLSIGSKDGGSVVQVTYK